MSGDMVRIVIDEDLCAGYGECVAEDADAVVVEDDLARVIESPISLARARCLCESCPVGAISIAA